MGCVWVYMQKVSIFLWCSSKYRQLLQSDNNSWISFTKRDGHTVEAYRIAYSMFPKIPTAYPLCVCVLSQKSHLLPPPPPNEFFTEKKRLGMIFPS